MGQILGPFGIKGWVRLKVFTDTQNGLAHYPRWFVEQGSAWVEHAVLEAGIQGKALVARLSGCANRDEAQRLKGCKIGIPRAALPAAAANEFYWADLIGLEVTNVRSQIMGKVTEIFSTGANDVLVVEGDKRHLIPFISQVILNVEKEAGVITVDWEIDY